MSESFSSTLPLSFDPSHEHVNSRPSSVESDGIFPNEDDSHVSPIFHCMLAGGFGGLVGDSSMHSLDTIKTRQQGFSDNIRYKRMIPAYYYVFRNEGIRGLYGGYAPAMLGSLPSTATFFGTYEYCKRKLIGVYQLNETFAYFISGVMGDLASSIFYVPSEVLKARLQLQGAHNNPNTIGSGYNYRGLSDAISSIVKKEGILTLTYGYKETLLRDLPFSALQFAFYERFRQIAIFYNKSDELPITFELVTGAGAGGLAGILTTPLDVIKTRIQTAPASDIDKTIKSSMKFPVHLSTAEALVSIYRTEGIIGLFSGVGPRFIWTGVQSSIMLLLYQISLREIDVCLGNADPNIQGGFSP